MYVFNRTPGRGINRLVRFLKPWPKPDSIGVQEVGEHTEKLADARGYRVFFKRPDEDTRRRGIDPRHVRNNAILLKRSLEVIDFEYIHAADGTDSKYCPPRSIVVLKYKKRGRDIAHVNTHLHVVPEEELPNTPESKYGEAARQYADHSILLNKTVERLRRTGYIVVVTGDMNTRPKTTARPWKYSVYNYIVRASMAVVRHGVDLIAYDNFKLRLMEHKFVPNHITGSDAHDAIAVTFKFK